MRTTLEADSLAKTWGDRTIFSGISLRVERGLTAVAGENDWNEKAMEDAIRRFAEAQGVKLGFIVAIAGLGTKASALSALALVIAHALSLRERAGLRETDTTLRFVTVETKPLTCATCINYHKCRAAGVSG